jgi:hypothetical protein
MLAATKTRRRIRFPELVRASVSCIMSGLVLVWLGWPQRLQVALAVIPKKLPCIPHHGRKMLTRQSAPAVRLNRLTPRDVTVVRAVKSLRLGSQKGSRMELAYWIIGIVRIRLRKGLTVLSFRPSGFILLILEDPFLDLVARD